MTRPTLAVLLACLFTVTTAALADDWPQWRGPQRDGVWRETGILEKFDKPRLEPRWSVPIGSGYSGPSVAAGRVYVTDYLDEPRETERVHCFEAATGKPLWSHQYDVSYAPIAYKAGPRINVLVHDGLAYSLGAVGHLHCFDAASGTLKWKKDLAVEYAIDMPRWGIGASPIIEGDLLIAHIGGKNACVIALDRRTGEPRWKSLPDQASYSAPITIDQAGRRVLVVYTAGRVVGLDVSTGEELWANERGVGPWPITIATPVVHRDLLFVSNAHVGSALLRLRQDRPAVDLVWERNGARNKDPNTLHSLIPTPLVIGEHIYGVHGNGELRCLELLTGNRVWEDTSLCPPARWATMHLTPHGENVWVFNERGELIITHLSPQGVREISRTAILEPTRPQLNQRGGVTWSHPAFANRHIFARNDEKLICIDLSAARPN